MNRKIMTSIVIMLATGIAAYIYSRKKNKLSTAAEDTYDIMNDAFRQIERKTEPLFS